MKKMYLNFQNKSFWESLHLKNGLEDWDMAEELTLTIAAEDFLQEPSVQPHLWMWVNPSLVCPIPGRPGVNPAGSDSPMASVAGAVETSSPNTSWDYSDPGCSKEGVLSSSSKAGKFTEDEDALRVNIPVPQEMLENPELRAMLMPRKSAVLRLQSVTLRCPRQTSTKIEGGWPRPPLNYCILITLALCNSTSGSLTVQQIYQFTRLHFPFFQTAPESWKNTIRHNLCFSSSFEKTTGCMCGEGNRKSCLWKLTPEGHRRFQEEAQALPKEALDLVCQSMSEPRTFQRAGAPQNAERASLYKIPMVGGTEVGAQASIQPPALPGVRSRRRYQTLKRSPHKRGSVTRVAKSPSFVKPTW
ncbi:forkhead box protein R1 isoform X1 [Phalacrocorax aristotelis]|uniref:forkhead box protein R1 isoform X1 n=1 Tax=Phalacrocorax aristotelis TaxID=126867 RepID=UPI003F4BF819